MIIYRKLMQVLYHRWLWLWFPTFFLVVSTFLCFFTPRVFINHWMGESGVVEILQTIFLVGTIGFFIGITKRVTGIIKAFVVVVILLIVILLGEELSWGQHIFGWEAPEGVSRMNRQDETNLHNLNNPTVDNVKQVFRALILGVVVLVGVMLPLWTVQLPSHLVVSQQLLRAVSGREVLPVSVIFLTVNELGSLLFEVRGLLYHKFKYAYLDDAIAEPLYFGNELQEFYFYMFGMLLAGHVYLSLSSRGSPARDLFAAMCYTQIDRVLWGRIGRTLFVACMLLLTLAFVANFYGIQKEHIRTVFYITFVIGSVSLLILLPRKS